tara:strand:+ start:882 stop:1781 length:900 start_codon:yes stop_codon:yes gene_type:complete
MFYIKRTIELLKEGKFFKQLIFRLKTFFSLTFSKQKKGFFDLMEVQGKSENSFKIKHGEKNFFGVKLPLFEIDENNKLVIPPNTKKIMIDVGTSVDWGNSIKYLNENPKDSIVIGVEPNIDSWLLVKGLHFFNYRNHIEALPKYTKDLGEKIFFLPVALAPYEGFAKFYGHDKLGTSSLLDSAFETTNATVVPTITLAQIIDLIPDNIKFVEILKIDAEGFDLQILKSGGKNLSKVAIVTVECVNGHLFKEGYKSNEIYSFMKNNNFKIIPNSKIAGTDSFINLKYENELPNIKFRVKS